MDDDQDSVPMLTHHGLGFEPPQKKEPEEEKPQAPAFLKPKKKVQTIDPLEVEIEKITEAQSPSVKALIKKTECFGFGWLLPEEGECPESSCDLRSLCQLVYKRAHKDEEPKPEEDKDDPELQEFKKIDEENKQGKFKGTGMYERKPYVSKNRLSDRLAAMLWEALGSPPEIADTNWTYPGPNKTEKQRNQSAREFMRQYGAGLLVSKRANYHLYFFNGRHLIRMWVRHSTGCWTDLSSDLGMELMHNSTLEVKADLVRAAETPHQFFPYRTYINKKNQIKSLAEVLKPWGVAPE